MLELLHLEAIGGGQAALLLLCVFFALGFEFVNGFHDTANAVATVIYTNSLKPRQAVLMSGVLNFAGVWLGGIAVAMGIVKLLPVELLVASGPNGGLAMVLALLVAATSWNFGTWFLGIPASSSHTLIGAILGVGLASSWADGHLGQGVNWHKAEEIGLALLLSPAFGFLAAGGLVMAMNLTLRDRSLFQAPVGKKPPPWFVRSLMIFTSAGVSFAHGSNDGQKGVGILMLVLIGVVPSGYALNLDADPAGIHQTLDAALAIEATLERHADAAAAEEATEIRAQLGHLRDALSGRTTMADIPPEQRFEARQAILRADKRIAGLVDEGGLGLSEEEAKRLAADRKVMRHLTEYAPTWVLAAIATALGVGTTVGWRRIVVTVGEKIGKAQLTYAQGLSAGIVAMSTIGLSGWAGWPVSTTHVLSSGVAGSMVALRAGVQGNTLRNLLLAWVLTFPVSMALSATLFLVFRAIL